MAAACGKLQHMFYKPLLENPTLIQSLSWNHIKPSENTRHVDPPSFTEIFGELYFKEASDTPPSSMTCSVSSSSILPSSSPMTCTDVDKNHESEKNGKCNEAIKKSVPRMDAFSSKCYTTSSHKISDSFSSMSSESLQLCTEGLGFESSDNSDDLETQDYYLQDLKWSRSKAVKHPPLENPCSSGEIRRPRVKRGPFPPPISSLGKNGKAGVCFKSYRQDGRFVLKEFRIPTQECLHASREDGRLKLSFVHKDDDCDYSTLSEDQEKENWVKEMTTTIENK